MISYIEYLKIPTMLALTIVGAFLVMQIVGEILEFNGKIVPEFVKIRKIFARKRMEKKMVYEAGVTLSEVRQLLQDINCHYSEDNIRMRDKWMESVDDRLNRYDVSINEIGTKLDKNNQDTLSLLVENKRGSIIDFASLVSNERSAVTREQFNRIFRIYDEYESIIEANGMTNGEVDIAIRIIRESYENHVRNHSFVEDIRGYINA